MGRMVDGEWGTSKVATDEAGHFIRKETSFRSFVEEVEPMRYHLYVSLACPWAHRTLCVRSLRKLDDVISVSVVDHFMGDDGWFFSDTPGSVPDTVNHKKFLYEIYALADPGYTGRVTVPVLWDTKEETIVNNESREIIRMMDTSFMAYGDPDVCFFPEAYSDEIDEVLDRIYQPINNGVYRAGFARTQEAYYEAVTELFEALDYWEEVLSGQRFMCGNEITEADWCFFTTLLRFDLVYHGHFKCNIRRIVDYPNLFNYLKDLYQRPGIRETCNFDHIKKHYYRSHTSLNPKGIVPKGPLMALGAAHDRARFS